MTNYQLFDHTQTTVQIAPGAQYSGAIAILGGSQKKKKTTSALRALLRPLSLGGPLEHVRNSSLRRLQPFTDRRVVLV
jgi:hypothetical protein